MGQRYRWITENDGLLEKVGTNLLSCTAQHRSFKIDYHLFILHVYCKFLSINSIFGASFQCVFIKKQKKSIVFCLLFLNAYFKTFYCNLFNVKISSALHIVYFGPFITRVEVTHGVIVPYCADIWWSTRLFFNLCGGTLGTAATTGLLHQPRMIGKGDCGKNGEMNTGRGNRSTRRKPAPAPLCPPQIPQD
jgi:hypothetical protein